MESVFKTVHLKTSKIISYGANGQPIFETIVQKLRSNGNNDDFEAVIAVTPAVGYASVEVVGVFDLKTHEPIEGAIKKYQAKVDAILKPQPVEETQDVTAVIEENKQLKENMAKIMDRLDAMENKADTTPVTPVTEDSDAEYKAELKAEIKSLGGRIQGLITIDQLEARRDSLTNPED
tara:strand:+ start:8005 stop:8538 length:534 start_codon:yes stop_codon:yes gene_type:complete